MLLFFLVPLAVLGVLSTALVVFLLGVPLVTLPHGKSGQPRKLMAGRYTAPPPPTDVVAIIVGLQIRQLWRVTEWVPVVIANLSLLYGLSQGVGGEGFLSSQLFVGNPLINIQYWRSFDDLVAYSRRPANQHFVRWVKFSQKLKAGNVKSIGLFHEVYKAQPEHLRPSTYRWSRQV
ncbi:hypothetical protein WJX84_008738 [Apatococcus fuscideae]|uniref:DUF3291 domain-containing protein n=1 Tax=Apatococcus fuscideae TaxID=2026836 RepID=A0AAW1SKI3_9CHLO